MRSAPPGKAGKRCSRHSFCIRVQWSSHFRRPLWLRFNRLGSAASTGSGHESTNTTHRYVEADLAMKEKALAQLEAPDTKLRRFCAPNSLMRFLQSL